MGRFLATVAAVGVVLLLLVSGGLIAALSGGAWAYPKWKNCEEPFNCPVTITPQGNETEYVNSTEVIYETIHEHHHHQPEQPDDQPPPTITVIEPAKYWLSVDFNVEACLSSVPRECVTWTGNGFPYVNIRYTAGMDGNGPVFNDTEILHNSWVYPHVQAGFNLCNYPILRLNEFAVAPYVHDQAPMTYSTIPLSDDGVWAYMGTGELCAARAAAMSAWMWGFCHEGDGVIEPIYFEEHPEENVIHRHIDIMDYCGGTTGKFPI